jgi:hypothetical protein
MSESIEHLEERLKELDEQQKQTEATYHQITGAKMMVEGMIQEAKDGKKDDKKDNKKSKVNA